MSSQSEKAMDIYKDLIAADPRNDAARTGLIQTLINSGSPDAAAKLAADGARQAGASQPKYKQLLERALAEKASKTM
jgi:thioredoxin-like negative regulator of GroEL